MKNLLLSLTLLISFFITSCSSDDDVSQTKATITVEDIANQPVPEMIVYAYTNDTWNVIGDDPLFADKTVSSNQNGKAVFILDMPTLFATETQETIHFSVHYILGDIEKTKNTSLTFERGQQKSTTIILN